MDEEMRQLAVAAADTVVKLAATEAWDRLRAGVASLWRRFFPERVDSVEARLTETRADILAFREAGNVQGEMDIAREWAGLLRRLLAADRGFEGALRTLVAELQAALPEQQLRPAGTTIEMHATAEGDSRIYMAGQDLYLSEG